MVAIKTQEILKSSISTVGLVVSLVSTYNIVDAPPIPEGVKGQVGFVSILLLILLLFIKAARILWRKNVRIFFVKIAALATLTFVVSYISYLEFWSECVRVKVEAEMIDSKNDVLWIVGSEYNEKIREFLQSGREEIESDTTAFLMENSSRPENIWTEDSLRFNRRLLLFLYLLLFFSAGTAIFSLLEGVLASPIEVLNGKSQL